MTAYDPTAYDHDAPVFDMTSAAHHLGITPNTLRAYRFKRYPPPHPHAFPDPIMHAGGRVPMWTRNQLDAWTELRSAPSSGKLQA